MAAIEPQGRLFPAVVFCWFDVTATGRPLAFVAFERGTFEMVPRCKFGGEFAGTPLARRHGPRGGPRGTSPFNISFSSLMLDEFQNIRRRQVVKVVFESVEDKIKNPYTMASGSFELSFPCASG